MKTMFIKSKSSKKKGPSRADRSGLSAQPADGPRAGGRPQIGQGKGLGRDDTQHSGHGRGGGDDEEEDDAESGGLLASVKAFVAAVLKCNIRAFTSELAAAGNHRIAQDDDYMSQLLMDLFKEASTPEHVAPGKAFVVEGTKVDLFLIVSGTAVIRMSNPDGTYKELSQMRTAGDLIGDVSFLTGGTALASVVATPLAKGQTEPLEPTMVCKMSFSDISNLLESHPELMHKFFWAIGAIISKRLNALSHDTQKLLHPQHSRTGADGAMKLHAAAQLAKTSALALLGQFGLNAGSAYEAERMLQGSCDCTISSEDNSAFGTDTDARLFVFTTHLCIEKPGMLCMPNRQAIPLGDVLSLVHPKGFGVQPDGTKTCDLQMKGHSLRVSMPVATMAEFEGFVEEARLRSTDISSLAVEEEEEDEAPGVRGSVLSGFLTPSSGANQSSPPGRRKESLDQEAAIEKAKKHLMDAYMEGSFKEGLIGESFKHATASNKAGAAHMNALSREEWDLLFRGATARRLPRNGRAVASNRKLDGLLVVVKGVLRAQVDVPGRPQALVVGRLSVGELLGTNAFILGSFPWAAVFVESDGAELVRLPARELFATFAEHPIIAGKFYCLLATSQADKLRIFNSQTSTELTVTEGSNAPSTMKAIADNPAFLIILHKFVATLPGAEKKLMPVLEFVNEVKRLQQEPDPAQLRKLIQLIHSRHMAPGGEGFVEFPTDLAGTMQQAVAAAGSTNERVSSGQALSHELRHVYDDGEAYCLRLLEDECLSRFLSATHYEYVLQLLAKEKAPVTIEHFTVVRMLGEGAFGQVLEVIKRDCGKRYAMKVMSKEKVSEVFEDEWERIVLVERKLMASLHHPLLINLAYAYQNIRYLILVMDLSHCGDLESFGVDGDLEFNADQVHFVGLECAAILCHLHSMNVMFRDLKPANLLLDDGGHVRLIDFGIAQEGKEGKDGSPVTSTAICGSGVYVAPEVTKVGQRGYGAYGSACDMFSFGVLLYELTEKAWPFGTNPAYADVNAEFIQPALLADDGTSEIPHLYDLLTGLLDWSPGDRLGGGKDGANALKSHPYWNDFNGEPVDWELVNNRRMISPLLGISQQRLLSWEKKEKSDLDVALAHGKSAKNRRASYDAGLASFAKLANARQEQNKVEQYQASFKQRKGGKVQEDKALSELADLELEMSVEGWEFNSQNAIAEEYVESYTDVVSTL